MRSSSLSTAILAAGLSAAAIIAAPSIGPGMRRVTRARVDGLPHGFTPANINRHTGRPHEHKREIARRLRQERAK